MPKITNKQLKSMIFKKKKAAAETAQNLKSATQKALVGKAPTAVSGIKKTYVEANKTEPVKLPEVRATAAPAPVVETKKALSATDDLKGTYKSFNEAFGAAKTAGLKTFMWGKMPIAVKMAGDKGATTTKKATENKPATTTPTTNVNPIWGPGGNGTPVNPWTAAKQSPGPAPTAIVATQRGVINPQSSAYNPNSGETILVPGTTKVGATTNVNPILPTKSSASSPKSQAMYPKSAIQLMQEAFTPNPKSAIEYLQDGVNSTKPIVKKINKARNDPNDRWFYHPK